LGGSQKQFRSSFWTRWGKKCRCILLWGAQWHAGRVEIGVGHVLLPTEGLKEGVCSYLSSNFFWVASGGCLLSASSADHDDRFFMTEPAFVAGCVPRERVSSACSTQLSWTSKSRRLKSSTRPDHFRYALSCAQDSRCWQDPKTCHRADRPGLADLVRYSGKIVKIEGARKGQWRGLFTMLTF
jgi:hypothetical protein